MGAERTPARPAQLARYSANSADQRRVTNSRCDHCRDAEQPRQPDEVASDCQSRARDSTASYLVRLFDGEGHITHCHTISANWNDAIIRKAASLYRSRPFVDISAGDRVIARLTAEEMAAIDGK
jgi:hypothetical protein